MLNFKSPVKQNSQQVRNNFFILTLNVFSESLNHDKGIRPFNVTFVSGWRKIKIFLHWSLDFCFVADFDPLAIELIQDFRIRWSEDFDIIGPTCFFFCAVIKDLHALTIRHSLTWDCLSDPNCIFLNLTRPC